MIALAWAVIVLSMVASGEKRLPDVDPDLLPAAQISSSSDQSALYSSEPVPASRVSPRYPKKAMEECVEGVVAMKVGIAPDGRVSNVEVVSATPPGYFFEKTAREAVLQWRYKRLEGRPIHRSTELEIEFRLPAEFRTNCPAS